jgi:hypothetical protein
MEFPELKSARTADWQAVPSQSSKQILKIVASEPPRTILISLVMGEQILARALISFA